MRILFLDDAVFEDLPGGSRMAARELALELTRRGHDITFLVPRHNDHAPADTRQDGLRIIRYGGAHHPLAFLREGRAACARLLAESPIDLVHTQFAYAALGPLPVVPKNVPRVRTFHGPWDEEGWSEDARDARSPFLRVKAMLKKRLRYEVEAINFRQSDRVIVLSDFFHQEVTGRFGVPDAKVSKIAGGVDLARFVPVGNKDDVRRALDLPPGRAVLLSVRRLTQRMGLDNLVEAMTAVAARRPDVLLLIGGKGPEREALERQITRHGLEEHVRLVGFIPDDDLAQYYQAADAFVLPTVALEGFGLVTLESLACGVPVIGTPIGATPEILTSLDPRLIAQSALPADLARSILDFLDGGWRHELAPARLHQFVRERFSWERNARETEALYVSLLAQKA